MTYLSRLAKLGGTKEGTPYTYSVPTFSVPFNSGSKYTDIIDPLRDESMRANDVILQGLYQGSGRSELTVECNGYADLAGNWFRAMIGPDTVAAGTSTTLAANSLINATSLSLTASVPSNSVIQISDTAGANLEYVQVGTVTGSGPYTAPVTAGGGTGGNSTQFAHTASGGSVVAQSTHTFKQNRSFSTVWPTYSWTTNDGATQLGWVGAVMSELGMKIDPKGLLTFSLKYTGFLSQAEADFSYAASAAAPLLGWSWTVTNGGAASTRGLTMDITAKRPVEAIIASDGAQSPREIFPGALEIDGSYKAIFENTSDVNLFRNYSQLPTVHTLTQPAVIGGASIAVTMSKSGYTTAERDLGQAYIQLSQSLSGIGNTTDLGVASVVLSNFVSSAY